MKYRELIGSLFLFIVGCLFCFVAYYRYNLFSAGLPGAGFFPFIAGIILMVLACVVFVSDLVIRKKGEAKRTEEKIFSRQDSMRKILFILGALLIYWIILEYGGFLLTTFFFMLFLMRAVEPQKWSTSLVIAFLTSFFCYILFNILLEVQLPKGIIGL